MSLYCDGYWPHDTSYMSCAVASVTPDYGITKTYKRLFVCGIVAPSYSLCYGDDICDIMFVGNFRNRSNYQQDPGQLRLSRQTEGASSYEFNRFSPMANASSGGQASYWWLTNLSDPLSTPDHSDWDVPNFVAMYIDGTSWTTDAPASVDIWSGPVGGTINKSVCLEQIIVASSDFVDALNPFCIGGVDGTVFNGSLESNTLLRGMRGRMANVAFSFVPPATGDSANWTTLINHLAAGGSPCHPTVRTWFPVGTGKASCYPLSSRIGAGLGDALGGTSGSLTLRRNAVIVPDMSGVSIMSALAPTIVQDGWADFTAANQDKNSGDGVIVVVRANAGGTNNGRAFLDFGDLIALGIPSGSTITSATLTMECTLVVTASAQPLEVRAVTRAIVEGTGTAQDATDGLCWDRYDATNTWTVEGGDFVGTADDNTTDPNLTSPLVAGSYPYIVTNSVAACMASVSGKCVLCLKRKTELTTGSSVQYSSSEGATPPTLSITYTPPPAASGRNNPQGVPARRLRRLRLAVSQEQ